MLADKTISERNRKNARSNERQQFFLLYYAERIFVGICFYNLANKNVHIKINDFYASNRTFLYDFFSSKQQIVQINFDLSSKLSGSLSLYFCPELFPELGSGLYRQVFEKLKNSVLDYLEDHTMLTTTKSTISSTTPKNLEKTRKPRS